MCGRADPGMKKPRSRTGQGSFPNSRPFDACFTWPQAGRLKSTAERCLSSLHVDHPRHAEAVGEHAETRREERLGQRHPYLPAVAQGTEASLGLVKLRLLGSSGDFAALGKNRSFASLGNRGRGL